MWLFVTGEVWFDGPQLGSWNMAMDQAMLEHASATQQILLRIYQWSKPTISLGYFQAYDDLAGFPELHSLDCVRRVTGGGAILHDREITYSLAIPGEKQHMGHNGELYRTVHRAVVAWLQALGMQANFWEDSNRASVNAYPREGSFWCFERRSGVDIVIDDQKVFGSAQRRNSTGLLQHGSLLLEASMWRPQLLGIVLERPGETDFDAKQCLTASELGKVIGNVLVSTFGYDLRTGNADRNVIERAEIMDAERFSTLGWTQSKNR